MAKNRYKILKSKYESLLDELFELDDADEITDVVLECYSLEGELIRFSWKDRNVAYQEREGQSCNPKKNENKKKYNVKYMIVEFNTEDHER